MRGRFAGLLLLVVIGPGPSVGAEGNEMFQRLIIHGGPVRWQPDSDMVPVVTYALASSEISRPQAINCQKLRGPADLLRSSEISLTDFKRALRNAFDRWERVSGIVFAEAQPGRQAQILIGEQSDPKGFAYTDLTLGSGGGGESRAILGASICLNPLRKWKRGFDGNLSNYDLEYTLTHEIGHAIGLDHPSPRGHWMSFSYSETETELTAGDVGGAVAIYGAPRERNHPSEHIVQKQKVAPEEKMLVPLSRGLEKPDAW